MAEGASATHASTASLARSFDLVPNRVIGTPQNGFIGLRTSLKKGGSVLKRRKLALTKALRTFVHDLGFTCIHDASVML